MKKYRKFHSIILSVSIFSLGFPTLAEAADYRVLNDSYRYCIYYMVNDDGATWKMSPRARLTYNSARYNKIVFALGDCLRPGLAKRSIRILYRSDSGGDLISDDNKFKFYRGAR